MLDQSVPKVIVQFSCANRAVVPDDIPHRRETNEERSRRNVRTHNGTLVYEPREHCWVSDLPATLNEHYVLMDALSQERIDSTDPFGRRPYYIVRFVFLLRTMVNEQLGEQVEIRDTASSALQQLADQALWHVRVFANENPDHSLCLSVNCGARKPLFLPDGQPVMVWQKDENGRRIGDAALPLAGHPHPRVTVWESGIVAIAPAS